MSDFLTQDSGLAEYLTTTRTAKMLGVSARRVRAMAKARVLRAVRFGREWLVPFDEALYQTMKRRYLYTSTRMSRTT